MQHIAGGILYYSEPAVDAGEDYCGKGLKKVLMVVVPIVIGFVAGPIAGAIARSIGAAAGAGAGAGTGFLAHIASTAAYRTASSALVGAALGKITGVGAGAGAAAGGLGGLFGRGYGATQQGGSLVNGIKAQVGLNTAAATPSGAPLNAALPNAAASNPAAIATNAVTHAATGFLGNLQQGIGRLASTLAINGLAAALTSAKTPEEKAFLQQNGADIKAIMDRETDQYNREIAIQKLLFQRAQQFDPTYRANLAAANATASGARALADAERTILANGRSRNTGRLDATHRAGLIQIGLNSNEEYNKNLDYSTQADMFAKAAASPVHIPTTLYGASIYGGQNQITQRQNADAGRIAGLFGYGGTQNDYNTNIPDVYGGTTISPRG